MNNYSQYLVFGKLSVIEINVQTNHFDFFQKIQNSHKNKQYQFFFITPQNAVTGYKKEEMEYIKSILNMVNEQTHIIIVLGKAEKISESSANSLLLFLENISEKTAILFLTVNKTELLDTIVSRAICFVDTEIGINHNVPLNDLLKLFLTKFPFINTVINIIDKIEWEERIFNQFLNDLIYMLAVNNYSYLLIQKIKDIQQQEHFPSKVLYKYTLQILFMLIQDSHKV